MSEDATAELLRGAGVAPVLQNGWSPSHKCPCSYPLIGEGRRDTTETGGRKRM
jgi:hypothetical protein